jgi:hypothetical protein
MSHEIHRVTSFQKVAQFTLCVVFNDGTSQTTDFRPVWVISTVPYKSPPSLTASRWTTKLTRWYGQNGADFDPTILHNWPESGPALAALAEAWESEKSSRPTP